MDGLEFMFLLEASHLFCALKEDIHVGEWRGGISSERIRFFTEKCAVASITLHLSPFEHTLKRGGLGRI